jgi:hypothetical protein
MIEYYRQFVFKGSVSRVSAERVECLVIFENHAHPAVAGNIRKFLSVITALPDYQLLTPPTVSGEYLNYPSKLRVYPFVWDSSIDASIRSDDPSDDEDVSVRVSTRRDRK